MSLIYFELFSSESKWIANFGVVPLFLFLAFLLTPMFFLLRALLFFVTRVLETMAYLYLFIMEMTTYNKIRGIVKTIFVLHLPFYVFSAPLSGESNINMRRHQVKFINLDINESYLIEPPNFLNSKLKPKENKLMIQARKLGTGWIILVNKKTDESRMIKVLVQGQKKAQSKLQKIQKNLKKFGIQFHMQMSHLILKGVISNLKQFRYLEHLSRTKTQINTKEVTLSLNLKNKLISNIYQFLKKLNISEYKCYLENVHFLCHINNSLNIDPQLITQFYPRPLFKFIHRNKSIRFENFKVKSKIILSENIDGKEVGSGFSSLGISYQDLFDKNFSSLLEENFISLSQKSLKVSTLAQPSFYLVPGRPHHYKLGSDVAFEFPFSNDPQGRGETRWRFAGLELTISLEKNNNKYRLDYKNALTTFGEGRSVEGSRSKGSVYLRPGDIIKIFTIDFKSSLKNKKNLPYLSSVPILGEIFGSTQKISTYKKIEAFIKLERNE